ncbi:biopolymer transporter ExbD [Bdellovibrionota bacterium FG-1]
MSSFTSGSGHDNSQDFELNLASIIDCFTVLIAFVLASASFLSIGMLDGGIAAAAPQAASDHPPSISLTVELSANHQLAVKISGKESGATSIVASENQWNYKKLTESLAAAKARHSDTQAVTLTADNSIAYKDVVKAMEVIRQTIPVVLLGGF